MNQPLVLPNGQFKRHIEETHTKKKTFKTLVVLNVEQIYNFDMAKFIGGLKHNIKYISLFINNIRLQFASEKQCDLNHFEDYSVKEGDYNL